jgi:hypothetical protein
MKLPKLPLTILQKFQISIPTDPKISPLQASVNLILVSRFHFHVKQFSFITDNFIFSSYILDMGEIFQ